MHTHECPAIRGRRRRSPDGTTSGLGAGKPRLFALAIAEHELAFALLLLGLAFATILSFAALSFRATLVILAFLAFILSFATLVLLAIALAFLAFILSFAALVFLAFAALVILAFALAAAILSCIAATHMHTPYMVHMQNKLKILTCKLHKFDYVFQCMHDIDMEKLARVELADFDDFGGVAPERPYHACMESYMDLHTHIIKLWLYVPWHHSIPLQHMYEQHMYEQHISNLGVVVLDLALGQLALCLHTQ